MSRADLVKSRNCPGAAAILTPPPVAADLSIALLTGLHGAAATVLICSLLLIDEAGVPLFFAPNEVLLMLGGLLLASGGLSPVVFPPLAVLALLAGSFTGFSWARAVGPTHLQTIARRLGGARYYERAVSRASGASPRHLMAARLVPGIRVYVSLAAGAGQMAPGRFLRGNVPAVVAWAAGTMGIGFVAGIPVIHFLGYVQNLALSGAVFILLGFFAWRAVRRAPTNRDARHPGPFAGIRRAHRYVLAAALDAGIVATLTVGVDLIVLAALHVHIPFVPAESIFEPLTIVASVALFYAVVSRRSSAGRTAGERLLDVGYGRGRGHAEGGSASQARRGATLDLIR
ncbi:MAG TPA: VTT domain-containing protein [Candidatus Binatia bacterium]|nr:VTT domain-containing protein [Candidatus Binatia bacterium]